MTVLAAREPLRLYYDAPRQCWATGCRLSAAGHMVWLNQATGELWREEVCVQHLQGLRALVARAGGGALFFPLDRCPPLETIAAAVRGYLQRRQQAQAQWAQQRTFYGTGTGTTTTTYMTFQFR